jgi:hypothetical protein
MIIAAIGAPVQFASTLGGRYVYPCYPCHPWLNNEFPPRKNLAFKLCASDFSLG